MSSLRILAFVCLILGAFAIFALRSHAHPQAQSAAHHENGCDGKWQPAANGPGRRCKVDVDEILAQQQNPDQPHAELLISRSNHEGFVFERTRGDFRIGHLKPFPSNPKGCPRHPFKTQYGDDDPDDPNTGRGYARHHDTGEPQQIADDPELCEYQLYIQHHDGDEADPHIGLMR
ncbi:MAG TPA: hypothetical protein VGC88_09195 [Terriglobales bacterium]